MKCCEFLQVLDHITHRCPADSDHFAGRKKILNKVEKTIDPTEEGRPENVAISGIRGMDKTSLVFKLREFVPDTCFLSYYAPTKVMKAQEFVDTLLRKMDLQYQNGLVGFIITTQRNTSFERQNIRSDLNN